MTTQPGILDPLAPQGRYLWLQRPPGGDAREALRALASLPLPGVVGLGASLVAAGGANIEGLRPFPALIGPGGSPPADNRDLWIWLRGDDRGDLVHATVALEEALGDHFEIVDLADAFLHRDSRDLSGYTDGTENPTGQDAVEAAVVGAGPLAGSSFAAVQRWRHALARLR